jgi:hypothetical protein
VIIHAGSFQIPKPADLIMSAGHDVVAKDSAVVLHPVIRKTMARARIDDTPTPQWTAKRQQPQAHLPLPAIKQPLFCKCRYELAGHLAFMFR